MSPDAEPGAPCKGPPLAAVQVVDAHVHRARRAELQLHVNAAMEGIGPRASKLRACAFVSRAGILKRYGMDPDDGVIACLAVNRDPDVHLREANVHRHVSAVEPTRGHSVQAEIESQLLGQGELAAEPVLPRAG